MEFGDATPICSSVQNDVKLKPWGGGEKCFYHESLIIFSPVFMICHLVGIIICFFNVLKLVIFFNKKHKHSRVLNFFFLVSETEKKNHDNFFAKKSTKKVFQKQLKEKFDTKTK